jgi:hypothetical protein
VIWLAGTILYLLAAIAVGKLLRRVSSRYPVASDG